jgi:hypothetical protein
LITLSGCVSAAGATEAPDTVWFYRLFNTDFDRVCRQPRQSLTGMIKVALKPKTYAYGRA